MYVTDNRSIKAICHEIVESLSNFLQERIDVDEYFINSIKPVANLDINANIRNAFDVLGHDLELAILNMEYTDLMEHDRLEELRKMPLPTLIQYLSGSSEFKNITVLSPAICRGHYSIIKHR